MEPIEHLPGSTFSRILFRAMVAGHRTKILGAAMRFDRRERVAILLLMAGLFLPPVFYRSTTNFSANSRSGEILELLWIWN